MDINKYIGEKIKHFRTSKNLTQQEVAEYFISHLDSVQREKNVQNLSQIMYDFKHANINISVPKRIMKTLCVMLPKMINR